MTIIYFILILGITVFIHEFGHFMFAKKFGVYVYEFSIGMGPRLFKFKRKNDETEYSIRLLPIGGYVQMAGEDIKEDEKVPKGKSLQDKKAYQRFLIMVAGVMMNFILAIVLFFFIGLFNKTSINHVYIKDSIVDGLNSGDKIVKVNNSFVNNYDKLSLELAVVGENDLSLTVEDNNGKEKEIDLDVIKIGEDNLILGNDYGFSVKKLKVIKSSNDEINKNDVIVKVNGNKVDEYLELLKELKDSKDTIIFTFKDTDGNLKEVSVNVKKVKNEELLSYTYGFYLTGTYKKGFFQAIKFAFCKFFSTLEQMIFTIIYLITGKISLTMLSGPVGIYSVVGTYSKAGITSLISLLCLICVNVGFINLLPLPAFDGGHILFIIIEKIKGSRVDPKVENIIHTIGFILLMILMVFVTYNDILRLL